ncbi:hypothetical protein [Desulfobacter latus]|uniref:PIN domain-containing protein n=1 Tax=Desulfobacter latus TaxID=2292 RepID=A0A850T5T4_9BACT|nr:hypothetical protein [Desulfobacter latus]NWH04682.1 hypothetical protein [Desulfobacter latus]
MKKSIPENTKRRIPLGSVSINTRRANIFIDSCAFDPKYMPEDLASERLFQLYNAGEINLVISHSNMKEIEHPNVPPVVKMEADAKIYTIEVELSEAELILKEQILNLLAGNGRRDKMLQDSEHVFEAQKYGKFFVTTDKGILKRRVKLAQLCGILVVLPSEMLHLIEANAERC